jgi:hypothetical protein
MVSQLRLPTLHWYFSFGSRSSPLTILLSVRPGVSTSPGWSSRMLNECVNHLGGKGVHSERDEAGFSDVEVESEKVFALNEFAFEVFLHLLF